MTNNMRVIFLQSLFIKILIIKILGMNVTIYKIVESFFKN